MDYQFTAIGVNGFSCACCGAAIEKTDSVAVCPDCGAVYCRDCVLQGSMDGHQCEPDEED